MPESWHGTFSGYRHRGCRCSECLKANREKCAAFYAKNRQRSLVRQRDTRYNLADGQWDAMFAEQGGRCALCREEFSSTPVVDHDHSCCPEQTRSCGECVRGLLCSPCNKGLGFFRDAPDRLSRAMEYLSNRTVTA